MKWNPERLRRLAGLLQNQVDEGVLPGAVVMVGCGTETVYSHVVGYAENRNGVVRPMAEDTLFDLASLTKVVATLPCILSLIDDGDIRLQDSLALYFPEFAEEPKSSVTVRHLLTHTSGLISHRLYYATHPNREAILEAVKNESLQRNPGERVEYSDLGFMLLGEIVRIVTGQTLDQVAAARVFHPLGMKDTLFTPPETLFSRIASTEHSKVGIVHDENAESLGGISGHAGLFSTAADVVRYVQMWLGCHAPILSEAVRAAAVRNHTPGLNGNRGLGFVCRFDPYDHTGDLWPLTTVGHTGFTGTSLAFDPVSALWLVLLTNDVHYGRENRGIVRLRNRVHNVAASAIRTE